MSKITGPRKNAHPALTIELRDGLTWREMKAATERWLLAETLRETQGNMAAAGRRLGLSKVAVMFGCRRHAIDPKRFAGGGR